MALATFQLILALLVMCAFSMDACPDSCACGPYKGSTTHIAVDCSGRNLHDIPNNLPANTKSLNLANNNLVRLTTASLANTAIEELNLENNQLQTIEASMFKSLALKELNLKGNQLHEVLQDTFNLQGDCNLEKFIFNHLSPVRAGHWHIQNLTEAKWPCLVDLRNNPISVVESNAFSGSTNFTIFLSSTVDLSIQQAAFGGTHNVLGVHITHAPHLALNSGAFDGINNIGWIVIDNTDVALTEHLITSGTVSQPRWLRLSNSNIRHLSDRTLAMTMKVETVCSVHSFPYKDSGIINYSESNINMGGIEIVNNVLPALPANLIKHTNLGGIAFHGNRIMGFTTGVFSRGATPSEVCIIRFLNNRLDTISSGAFGGLNNVVHFSIYGNNLTAIEADAFKGSHHIGSLGIALSDDIPTEHTTVRANAFREVKDVKLFALTLGSGTNRDIFANQTRKLTIEPFAFDGLRNVDYMTLNLYDHVHILPNDFFTGLKVDQKLTLNAYKLTRIHQKAFGDSYYDKTSIARLGVNYIHNIPCDCETAKMNINLKQHVRVDTGLTCTAPFDDGSISHAWPLDHATCGAGKLGQSIIIISFILSYFMKG